MYCEPCIFPVCFLIVPRQFWFHSSRLLVQFRFAADVWCSQLIVPCPFLRLVNAHSCSGAAVYIPRNQYPTPRLWTATSAIGIAILFSLANIETLKSTYLIGRVGFLQVCWSAFACLLRVCVCVVLHLCVIWTIVITTGGDVLRNKPDDNDTIIRDNAAWKRRVRVRVRNAFLAKETVNWWLF